MKPEGLIYMSVCRGVKRVEKLKGYYENGQKTRYHKLKIGLLYYIHDFEKKNFQYISEIFHYGIN